MNTLALRTLIVCCSLGLAPFGVAAQQTPENKPPTILLSVHAENEGPNGLWIQAGKDLSATELDTFKRLLENSFTAMKDIRLVEVENKRDHVEVIVSLTKVRRGNGTWWYAASSVIGLATPKTDEFVTHNCIVGEDLQTNCKSHWVLFREYQITNCPWRIEQLMLATVHWDPRSLHSNGDSGSVVAKSRLHSLTRLREF